MIKFDIETEKLNRRLDEFIFIDNMIKLIYNDINIFNDMFIYKYVIFMILLQNVTGRFFS